jgi:spore germination protein YaaH
MRLDDGTEVWFENPESLLTKWQAAEKTGFRHLMIWRLGGNDERLFRFIHELRQQNYWGSHFEAS